MPTYYVHYGDQVFTVNMDRDQLLSRLKGPGVAEFNIDGDGWAAVVLSPGVPVSVFETGKNSSQTLNSES